MGSQMAFSIILFLKTQLQGSTIVSIFPWTGIAEFFHHFFLHSREKLGAFTSKCLNYVAQECLEDNVCPESLGIRGLVCINSTECRAAYVDLWGTILHMECNCGLTSATEESACKVFHHVFHNKSCFSKLNSLRLCISSSSFIIQVTVLTLSNQKGGYVQMNCYTPIFMVSGGEEVHQTAPAAPFAIHSLSICVFSSYCSLSELFLVCRSDIR